MNRFQLKPKIIIFSCSHREQKKLKLINLYKVSSYWSHFSQLYIINFHSKTNYKLSNCHSIPLITIKQTAKMIINIYFIDLFFSTLYCANYKYLYISFGLNNWKWLKENNMFNCRQPIDCLPFHWSIKYWIGITNNTQHHLTRKIELIQ